ncbi:MAG: ferritin [Planctomycetes bacterium]|nr:ferritin [Planctomycetota bacterium]
MTDAYHEPREELRQETIERHRAVRSIIEELEAVDWYDQRVDASRDEELKAVLAHNRDEEKEHAAMTLEWLRRHDAVLDRHLRRYLFTEAPITALEDAAGDAGDADEGGARPAPPRRGDGSLGIGSLRGRSA